jgi:hypothetical protein
MAAIIITDPYAQDIVQAHKCKLTEIYQVSDLESIDRNWLAMRLAAVKSVWPALPLDNKLKAF